MNFKKSHRCILTLLGDLCNNYNIPSGRYLYGEGITIKNEIITAALRLFLLRGYKYVSLVDVANEVGITKGGIYHYFSSKEDLLQVSVHRLFDDLKAKYLSLFNQNKSLREILEVFIVEREVETYFKRVFGIEQDLDCINAASFILEVMQCYPHIHKKIDDDQVEICASIAKLLRTASLKGEIRDDIDYDVLSLVIFTVVNGHGPVETFYKERENRKKIFEDFYKLIKKQ